MLNTVKKGIKSAYNTVVPYSAQRQVKKGFWILTIFGLMFVACRKDDPVEQAKNDVTIEWGYGNTDGVTTNNVQSYLAKPETKNVILECNGKSLGGYTSDVFVNGLKPCFDLDAKRVKGKGNMKDVTIQSVQDSLLFVGWGYTVNQK